MRIFLFLCMALSAPISQAQDAVARSLAATCANCHGTEGRSTTKDVASLAGLPSDYLVAQMNAFKSGARPSTIMQQLAKGYTDEQIARVAAYFSAQK